MASNSTFLYSYCQPVSKFWGGLDDPNRGYDEIDISLCFQDTVLLSGFSVIFILAALSQMLYYRKSKFRIPLTVVNFLKELFIALDILLVTAEAVFAIYTYLAYTNSVAIFQIVSPLISCFALFVALILVQFHRVRGIYTSGLFHVYWFLLLFLDGIKIRTYSLDIEGNELHQPDHATTSIVFLSFSCLNLLVRTILCIITLFADKIPESWFKGIDKPIPEEKATFLSQITWWWLNGLVITGFRRTLERSDLWSLNREDTTKYAAPLFRNCWEEEFRKKQAEIDKRPPVRDEDLLLKTIKSEKEPLIQSASGRGFFSSSLFSHKDDNPTRLPFVHTLVILAKTYWFPFLVCGLFKLIQDCLIFVSPQILSLLIAFVQNVDEPYWHGIVYAFILLAVSILQSVILHQYFQRGFVLGMNIRTALVSIIYRKALKLSHESRQKTTIGEIVNLMSVDAQRFMDLMSYIHLIWSAPFQILISVVFLYFTIQYAVFAGLVVMILMIPINSVIAAINRKFQKKLMILKDKRIKTITEILNGIKVIKLYAWEIPNQEEVLEIREQEMTVLKYSAILSAVSTFTWMLAPLLVALATFATYVIFGNVLTPQKAFVSLSLFNILRFPMTMLPFLVTFLVECSVSITRMNKFLNHEDLDPNSVKWSTNPAILGEATILVQNASYGWVKSGDSILKNINMRVDPGTLVSIVGQVGAGKSSFLMALLGEMDKHRGEAKLQGSVAFVPQLPWMQNATLRDNILFGAPYDPHRYQDVLRACALESDIQILPTGDQTEIGEKGINLSGGQKQRVSLARAVYQDSDVYFLDDTLSAVDAHVGQHIYQEVIGPNGLLKNKTRIFITHNLSYLSDSDYIAMFDHGTIVEQGEYNAVIGNNGEIAQLIDTFTTTGHTSGTSATDDDHKAGPISSEGKDLPIESKSADPDKSDKTGNIIDEEIADTGRVSLKVVYVYLKAVGLILSCIITLLFVLSYVANGGTSIWLAYWSNQYVVNPNTSSNTSNATTGPELGLYLGVYALLGVLQGFFASTSAYFFAIGAVYASRDLHKILLLNVIRLPMSFFEKTPIGRIMNRFSKDIYLIDESIPMSMSDFINTFFSVMVTIIIISYATPLFLIVVVPMIIFYLFVQRFYVCTSRQLKRIESITRSPVYSHFQESLSGVSTIRGYKMQNSFIQENEDRVDRNQEVYYPSISANRWLAIRLELVGHFVVFFAALFAVVSRELSITNAGLIGLSISYALSITQVLNWLVRMTSELEANIVSVERVKEYAELEREASPVTEKINLPDNWPQRGLVEFRKYSVKYREDLDLVIDNLDLEIADGQKLAIVGRTGAGKSSLTLALFRILEATRGSIVIDGVDIADVGLDDLRSRLTIIPQDPVLFSGTLRSNLDPFNTTPDARLWEALEHSHLKHHVEGMPKGLDFIIQEGGENLSVGQRQMVCLARALLRRTKILVLDEATAAIDMETDDIIQKTIREHFADCTVITIAHRLKTILDYDQVVVLSFGKSIEHDSPKNLIDKKGAFYDMVREAGLL
eukprot:TRINITY_DN821_c0_g1_i2.p1 TRINITY_DN821_c0_g1~~TRINITY_DN821_c0_g1_i2.p1  ORF type:complete len:1532 (-),score=331.57 TRINITY_DN821_c0_g1_i2:43-4638(-)